jgi:2-C-methyl-D-erythritol 4-phosphate cytidylyltransferase
MRTAVLVLAAGRGERLLQPIPKAFVPLGGRTLLERSLATMLKTSEIDLVQPVVSASDLSRYASLALDELEAMMGLCDPVPGGVERQDSVAAGLDALPDDVELVAVHDAARCLVTVDEVRSVLATAEANGAALLATPARDTIKRVRAGEVVETPTRSECWVAQTPQAFHVSLLREAIDKARTDGVLGTDDAQLVERLGVPVRVVEGSPRNIKITLPDDLALAERLLMSEEATER